MDLSYPFFQHFIQKHGKENLFDIIDTILNEFDNSIIIDLNISLDRYVQYIFVVATAQFLKFDDYKNIILLNSTTNNSLVYDYFKSLDTIKIHSKSISKIIFFLKQDFPDF